MSPYISPPYLPHISPASPPYLPQEMRARTFLARAENAMETTPLRLLVVLRLCPLVPCGRLDPPTLPPSPAPSPSP